jgi:hypothetical protein
MPVAEALDIQICTGNVGEMTVLGHSARRVPELGNLAESGSGRLVVASDLVAVGRDGKRWEEMGRDGKRWEEMHICVRVVHEWYMSVKTGTHQKDHQMTDG